MSQDAAAGSSPRTARRGRLGGFRTRDLVLVGGGPRATMVLERLAASAERLSASVDRPVRVHVIEPYEAGSGRLWRLDQSPLLKLNSMARDVSMFTDASVEASGPPWEGPALDEWAGAVRDGAITDVQIDDPDDLRRLRGLGGADFPTRRVHHHYLQWVWRRTVRRLESMPGIAGVTVHRTWAEEMTASARGGHGLRLIDGTSLHADVVVLLVGHTEALASPAERRRGAAAAAASGSYARPAFTNDIDWTGLGGGDRALVTGMGLGFIDLMALLYEGRGGRFRTAQGSDRPEDVESGAPLAYEPSGNEPLLWVGSRRGVPFHSKISVDLKVPFDPQAPRFLTAEAVDGLLERHAELDWDDHVWPLVAKEAGWHWYREIFLGHSDRIRDGVGWDTFARAYAAAEPGSAAMYRLLHDSLRDSRDQLDLHAVDRPLEGLTFEDAEQVQGAVLRAIRQDLADRSDPEQSQTLALFLSLLRSRVALMDLLPEERLNEPGLRTLNGWWPGFFSFVDSGPPAHRLQELLALHDAGFVRFLGPDVLVEHDADEGLFRARSRGGGPWIRAAHLIEARLPGPSLAGTANPVLRSVVSQGAGEEQSFPAAEDGVSISTGKLRTDAVHRVVDARGRAHPDLFAAGVFTSVSSLGAFARPHQNSEPFRSTDALAVRLWGALADAGARPDRDDIARQRAIESGTYMI